MFAPVFKPGGQPSSIARQQSNGLKRKRTEDVSDEETRTPSASSSDSESGTQTANAVSSLPVTQTDPYYVAGISREKPLPGFPFPHAAAKSIQQLQSTQNSDLTRLNPPLYVAKTEPKASSASLKRQRIENLTAILHGCMLKSDWKRASRTWGLLLRTEVRGRGLDLRRHGQWAVGAELLMRRDQPSRSSQKNSSQDAPTPPRRRMSDLTYEEYSPISDQGFELAREYYKRMILQYPHTTRTQNHFNALVVYPALFNIWVYQVQDRSKRAQQLQSNRRPSSSSSDRSHSTSQSTEPEPDRRILKEELDGAIVIAQELDPLLLSPPYDSSLVLLHLRGLIGIWISDLYESLSNEDNVDDSEASIRLEETLNVPQARQKAEAEKKVAIRHLQKANDGGYKLSSQIARYVVQNS